MISYNHGKFIGQAIESILSQNVDFLFELVIGDDFSSDNTFDICEEYARKDGRVKLLPRERNLGVMPNFSRTLLACTGKYIAVCEGDDYWSDARKLADQVSFLEAHSSFAGAAHQSDILFKNCFLRKFKSGVPEVIVLNDLTAGRLFHTASVMFRREVVDIFCQAPLVLSCDRLLNFCIALIGKIRYSSESMCVYRLHEGGMSSNVTVEQLKLDLSCIDYLKSIEPAFPRYQYRSYVYMTIGMAQNGPMVDRFWFLVLAFFYSFSYFPGNVFHMLRGVCRLLTRER